MKKDKTKEEVEFEKSTQELTFKPKINKPLAGRNISSKIEMKNVPGNKQS